MHRWFSAQEPYRLWVEPALFLRSHLTWLTQRSRDFIAYFARVTTAIAPHQIVSLNLTLLTTNLRLIKTQI